MEWHEFHLDSTGTQASMVVEDSPWVTVRLTDEAQVQSALSDPEEVEHSMSWHGLELIVRHTLSQWWTIRWMLHNPTDETVAVPDLAVRLDLAPDTCGWTWAAGAHGTVIAAPAYAAGPVLAWSVTLGCLRRVGKRLIVTPSGLVLKPGQRYVSSWRGARYASVAAARAEVPNWIDPHELVSGEPLVIPKPNSRITADLDVKLTPVTVDDRRVAFEVLGPPGESQVEIITGRGVTSLKPCWAPDFDALVHRVGSGLLAEDRSPTGAESVVLQYGLAQHLFADPETARARLALIWAAQREQVWGQLDVASAAMQAIADGDSPLVAEAIDRCRALPVGLGYAQVATRVWLAAAATDPGAGMVAAAEELFVRHEGSKPGMTELALLTQGDSQANQIAIHGVINRLGADMPGYPWALGRVRRAKIVGVLANCPQQTPLIAQTLLKTERRLTAMIWDGQCQPKDVEALAWLVLARS